MIPSLVCDYQTLAHYAAKYDGAIGIFSSVDSRDNASISDPYLGNCSSIRCLSNGFLPFIGQQLQLLARVQETVTLFTCDTSVVHARNVQGPMLRGVLSTIYFIFEALGGLCS